MTRVITYGTFDLIHYGHVRLLERAKALGDYLIVGVTSDDYDKARGKINVRQSLMERIEGIKGTGLADEIIIEEYEGQKIDDIRRYDIDIFTIGSDWAGRFDYLNAYCRVVYLDRTQGISSSDIRARKRALRIGLVGESSMIGKHWREAGYVNGLIVSGICAADRAAFRQQDGLLITGSYEELLENVDAVYIASLPAFHFEQARAALKRGKHVLCETPLTLSRQQCGQLFKLAEENGLIFMEALKTAYATAYNRLLLLIKSGRIGRVVSVDATCTSLRGLKNIRPESLVGQQNSLCAWGPIALLPVFQILGTGYLDRRINSCFIDREKTFDLFTKIDFQYSNAVASIKVGKGVKSEGELVVSGTRGYIYIPAPWWKTDYFEIRYENQEENKRYFYQLDGEGIRYELVAFLKSIERGESISYVEPAVSEAIAQVMEDFFVKRGLNEIMIEQE